MIYTKEIPKVDGIYPVRYSVGEGCYAHGVACLPRMGMLTFLQPDGARQSLNAWAVEWGQPIDFTETEHICLECTEPWLDQGGEDPCRYWMDDEATGSDPACERFRQKGTVEPGCPQWRNGMCHLGSGEIEGEPELVARSVPGAFGSTVSKMETTDDIWRAINELTMRVRYNEGSLYGTVGDPENIMEMFRHYSVRGKLEDLIKRIEKAEISLRAVMKLSGITMRVEKAKPLPFFTGDDTTQIPPGMDEIKFGAGAAKLTGDGSGERLPVMDANGYLVKHDPRVEKLAAILESFLETFSRYSGSSIDMSNSCRLFAAQCGEIAKGEK